MMAYYTCSYNTGFVDGEYVIATLSGGPLLSKREIIQREERERCVPGTH
jgi:hypothetical protein